MTHPWHDVDLGDEAPVVVNAIIEIPQGGTVKYELDKNSGLLRMDRVLYTAVHYPANYGFIPQTLAQDDDPLDILVLCQQPVQPLTLMLARPIGLMTMLDAGKRDHKVIAVAVADPQQSRYEAMSDLPPDRLRTLMRFFEDYKAPEDEKVEVNEFEPLELAQQVIRDAAARYQKNPHR